MSIDGKIEIGGPKQLSLDGLENTQHVVYNTPMDRHIVTEGSPFRPRSLEICAGAGGQALGLERAGFDHVCLVELDKHACATLKLNRPQWNVVQADIREFSAPSLRGIDLLAGGVPCPPFSKAGKQLGSSDERDLFPEAIRLVQELSPRAVMLENVRGLLDPVFEPYRNRISSQLVDLGYAPEWKLLHAASFGVPQLRPRVIMVARRIQDATSPFQWPVGQSDLTPQTVGEVLYDLMASNGWLGAGEWRRQANKIAPTIVGGSKRHGGPDLGPTRARQAWAELGVNGKLLANAAPSPDFVGIPSLTVRMVARLQGFPDSWLFAGPKTSAYRQVGNAFPPPVAAAVAETIYKNLTCWKSDERTSVSGRTISNCENDFSRELASIGFAD